MPTMRSDCSRKSRIGARHPGGPRTTPPCSTTPRRSPRAPRLDILNGRRIFSWCDGRTSPEKERPMKTRAPLAFGLNAAVPPEAAAAWGCRAIVRQDGHVDVVPDRQDLTGDPDTKALLQTWLNLGEPTDRPFCRWQRKAADMLKMRAMQTRTAGQFTLYQDQYGIIVGNTNASA